MHPSKFFEEVSCRTGIDVFEIYDNDLKETLKNVHPMNFIKTKVTLLVFRVSIEYDTKKGNHRTAKKYMIMNDPVDESGDMFCFADIEAESLMNDYNRDNPDNPMINLKINNVEQICDAVLPIG